jgi:hypothetical protein
MNNTLKVQRHELKFYISRSDYETASSILKTLMHKDEHQDENRGYFIRSLYFDDIADSSVEEKLDGIELRDKYRLRIYDTNLNWAKLERKRKVNQFVHKSSVTVSREEAEEIISGNYDCLLSKNSKDAVSIYFDLKRKYFRPVVIVDYIRDVFKMDYNEIRITFDKHLRANTEDFRLFSDKVITHPLQRDDVIEMEVKFNTCLPSWFKDFLCFESSVNLAISKYCHGRMGTREYYNVE